jgi:hypothetical protein
MIDRLMNLLSRTAVTIASPYIIYKRSYQHYAETKFLIDLLTGRDPDTFYVHAGTSSLSESDVEWMENKISDMFDQIDYSCEIVDSPDDANKILEMQDDGYQYSYRNYSGEWKTIVR